MTAAREPTGILSHLPRADGSATFSQNGFTIIGAVNGPIEVQRRDELPEEAAVDVVVRPASGVGGTRERHLESILQSTLRQVILIHNFPRTLIQITLQITETPENGTNLPILPALLQTSILTLLSATIPLAMTLTSTLLVVNEEGSSKSIVQNPTPVEIQQASSVHVFAFTSHYDLLVNESEGSFTMDDWNDLYDIAERLCCGSDADGDVDAMKDDGEDEVSGGMMQFVKAIMQEKVAADLHWRG
ncbi:MAG: exosome non-catalytic core subunit rrp46 [Claussenomyces sp. TS43310]|nr:MAG: exosome non-catalytic core subunit rrp46 [Claussenomyces sp. TS43310]